MYRSSQALLLGLLLGVWPVVDLGLSARPGLAQGVERSVELRKVEADRLLKEANAKLDAPEHQEDYSGALPLLEKALKLYQKLQDRPGEGYVLETLGRVFLGLRENDRALMVSQNALSIAREIKDRNLELQSLHNIGDYYKRFRRNKEALEFYAQSLNLARLTKSRKSEVEILREISYLLTPLNSRLIERIKYQEQILVIDRELKIKDYELYTLMSLVGDYYETARYAKAIEYAEQALEIFRIEKQKEEFQRNLFLRSRERNVLKDLEKIYRAYIPQVAKTANNSVKRRRGVSQNEESSAGRES
jgi:tetratricopeptide (TPR) repeat protein